MKLLKEIESRKAKDGNLIKWDKGRDIWYSIVDPNLVHFK